MQDLWRFDFIRESAEGRREIAGLRANFQRHIRATLSADNQTPWFAGGYYAVGFSGGAFIGLEAYDIDLRAQSAGRELAEKIE